MVQDRVALLTGLSVGIGLMYFFDPNRGRRRRALVRDKLVRATRVGGDAVETTSRDMGHRASGAAARLRRAVRREPVDDNVLVERVRAQLGRRVSHPHAIDVHATDGVVNLRGPILQAEAKRLLSAVERIPGVRAVVSDLDEHERPGNVPALQGGSSTVG